MKIIAHRGASGAYPENTLLAFQKTLEEGADGVEFDLHQTKDGVLVVHHDFDLKRTAGTPLSIAESRFEDLATYDLGAWKGHFPKQTLPTLDQVLAVFEDTDLTVNIELKAGSAIYPGIEEDLLSALHGQANPERFILSSFDHYALKKLRDLHSPHPLGVLTEARLIEPWHYLKGHGFQTYHPNWRALDPETAAGLKAQSIPIYTYTVNTGRAARRLRDWGVNGIITNHPQEIREKLNK
jgi:glycerophosphoryl diester phosphodiesterase